MATAGNFKTTNPVTAADLQMVFKVSEQLQATAQQQNELALGDVQDNSVFVSSLCWLLTNNRC